MSRDEQVQVVVVDDSVQFAFHVWRYLGQSIGIGGGPEPEKAFRNGADGPPRPLDTADGLASIWWVNGDSRWEESLRAVLAAIRPGPRLFLIDMRGKSTRTAMLRRKPMTQARDSGERLGKKVLGRVYEVKAEGDEVMMVSSYETGVVPVEGSPTTKPHRIEPKSPETLAKLRKKVLGMAAAVRSDVTAERERKRRTKSHPCLHILVTGAGFEIRDPKTGSFGLPRTPELLAEMGPPFRVGELSFQSKAEDELPGLRLKNSDESKQFRDVSRKDLDAWWNFLLERELLNIPRRSDAKLRGERKMGASSREREMREAFRRVILKYDWGHLKQALVGARLDWSAWLTTNYTRFADRAISLAEDRTDGAGKGPWQIVSTSIEALFLSREILHGDSAFRAATRNQTRYLFKLHGDVAHLQTMATAGQDKEFFSTLSVPVDSLHQVYSTAETLLAHQLQSQRGSRLVWHIVGHGLRDWLLSRLIAQVCLQRTARSTDFIIAGLEPFRAKAALQRFFKKHDLQMFADRIQTYRGSAEDYMARVDQAGGLPSSAPADWIRDWLASLGKTHHAHPAEAQTPQIVKSTAPTRSRPSKRKSGRSA